MGLFDSKPMKIHVSYKLDGIQYHEKYDSMPEATSAMNDLRSKAKKRKLKLENVKHRAGT